MYITSASPCVYQRTLRTAVNRATLPRRYALVGAVVVVVLLGYDVVVGYVYAQGNGGGGYPVCAAGKPGGVLVEQSDTPDRAKGSSKEAIKSSSVSSST